MLGSDTTTPSGLYARLCHAFLVLTVKATLNMSIMMMITMIKDSQNECQE